MQQQQGLPIHDAAGDQNQAAVPLRQHVLRQSRGLLKGCRAVASLQFYISSTHRASVQLTRTLQSLPN